MYPIIRVLIVNDDLLMRNTLHRLLAGARDMHLVDEITELQHCVARSLELQPHVVLIGGALKPFVFDLAALTTQVAHQTRLIAILEADNAPRAQALLETNLAGCLFQHEIDETLLHVIRAVAQGNTWFSRAVIERLIAPQATSQPRNEPEATLASHQLTRRDQQILACLLRGADNAQIAAELGLANQTVRNYVRQVCKKLGIPRNQLGNRRQIRL